MIADTITVPANKSLPASVVLVKTTVDVQAKYLACLTTGWALDGQVWTLAWEEIQGSPHDSATWEALLMGVSATRLQHPRFGLVPVDYTAIDVGFAATGTPPPSQPSIGWSPFAPQRPQTPTTPANLAILQGVCKKHRVAATGLPGPALSLRAAHERGATSRRGPIPRGVRRRIQAHHPRGQGSWHSSCLVETRCGLPLPGAHPSCSAFPRLPADSAVTSRPSAP